MNRMLLLLLAILVGCYDSTNPLDAGVLPDAGALPDAGPLDGGPLADTTPDGALSGDALRIYRAMEEAGRAHNSAVAVCGEEGFGPTTAAFVSCVSDIVVAAGEVEAVLDWFAEFKAIGEAMEACFLEMGCDLSTGCREAPIPVGPPEWRRAQRACLDS